MTSTTHANKPVTRAIAALNSMLKQVSAIHVEEIGLSWPVGERGERQREIDLVARVEVFGRSHTLACQISAGSAPEQARATLEELRSYAALLPGKVTPVLILPVLSPEARRLCDECQAGFLDLRGNGRLALDEVFISMRSLPRHALQHHASPHPVPRSTALGGRESSAGSVLRGFPPAQAGAACIAKPARHAASH